MKTIYGVVHVPAFPGDPHGTTFDEAVSHAMRDAEALASGGVHGLVIENFGSIPFPKGDALNRIPPHQVAAVTRIATKCKQAFEVAVGVNCLRNDAYSAMGIAAACDLDFIRVNVHVGAAEAGDGIVFLHQIEPGPASRSTGSTGRTTPTRFLYPALPGRTTNRRPRQRSS